MTADSTIKMFCFVENCYSQGNRKFDCACNQTKYFCEKHEETIEQRKKSCEIGWACCRCKLSAVKDHVNMIGIISENDIRFNACSKCVVELVDPWIAEYFESEKENRSDVFRAKAGTEYEKCYARIHSDFHPRLGG